MRFPAFLIGIIISVVGAIGLGLAVGLETLALVFFVIAVVVVVQLAYVGLVALMAYARHRKVSQKPGSTASPSTAAVTQENDA